MRIWGVKGAKISRDKIDFEILRGHRDPSESLEAGKVGSWILNVEDMHQGCEEQLELHLCDFIAKAHPLPGSKGHEMFGFVEFSILGEESLRSKDLRLLPHFRVHVDAVKKRDDVSVLRNNVALQLNSSVCSVLLFP